MTNPRLKAFEKECAKAKEDMLAKGKVLFADICKETFEANPELASFSWVQFTPYCNDGKPYEFRVHNDAEYDISLGFVDRSEYEGGDNCEDEAEIKKHTPLCEQISELVGAIDEDILEEMFGEGRVVCHRDGNVETEEYDHD